MNGQQGTSPSSSSSPSSTPQTASQQFAASLSGGGQRPGTVQLVSSTSGLMSGGGYARLIPISTASALGRSPTGTQRIIMPKTTANQIGVGGGNKVLVRTSSPMNMSSSGSSIQFTPTTKMTYNGNPVQIMKQQQVQLTPQQQKTYTQVTLTPEHAMGLTRVGGGGSFQKISPSSIATTTGSFDFGQGQFVQVSQQKGGGGGRVVIPVGGSGGGQPVQVMSRKAIMDQQQIRLKPLTQVQPVMKKTLVEIGTPTVPGVNSPTTGGGVKKKCIQMRLRCKSRVLPLHSMYFVEDTVTEMDADVIFVCGGDGGRVRGHKLILACASKFFTEIFLEQPGGEVATVYVDGIDSDVMKIIILLAYKSGVILSGEQMRKVREFVPIFGLDLKNMSIEEDTTTDTMDVFPGVKIDESFETFSTPEPPRFTSGSGIGNKRKFVPSFTKAQLQSLQCRKKTGGLMARSGSYQHPRFKQDDQSDNEDDEGDIFKIQGYEGGKEKHLESEEDTYGEGDMEYDSQQDEDGLEPEDDGLIKQWMANVGKAENAEATYKRGKYECRVCGSTFLKEKYWAFHVQRHYNQGIFKCQSCPEVRTTLKALYLHESTVHEPFPMSWMELDSNTVPSAIGRDKSLSPGPPPLRRAVPPTSSVTEMIQLRRLQQLHNQPPVNLPPSGHKGPLQGMKTYKAAPPPNGGQNGYWLEGNGHLDMLHIKQMQFFWVCAKCDGCSDTMTKAQNHYDKCYPDHEALFDDTVIKHRQGFYGKSKCPLCPRRYVSNGGWALHVGHQHQHLQNMFVHTGYIDEKLKCTNCNRRYPYPEDFVGHLKYGRQCMLPPISDTTASFTAKESDSENSTTEQKTAKKPAATAQPSKKKVTKVIQKEVKPPAPAPPPPPPPRSARLAKRQSALLMQKVLQESKDDEMEEERKSTPSSSRESRRRRSSTQVPDASTFSATDCPICGTSDVSNITSHLAESHADIGVSVRQVGDELLKCKKCALTFAICDLIDHSSNCEERPHISDESSNQSSIPEDIQMKNKPVHEIPPGVGTSEIGKMDLTLDQIMQKEFIEKAYECVVCQLKSTKLGEISACLRDHGVFRCCLCFNTYLNKESYDLHMKKCHYTSGKPKCMVCGKSFVNTGQCAQHVSSRHWIPLLDPKNSKKYTNESDKEEKVDGNENDEDVEESTDQDHSQDTSVDEQEDSSNTLNVSDDKEEQEEEEEAAISPREDQEEEDEAEVSQNDDEEMEYEGEGEEDVEQEDDGEEKDKSESVEETQEESVVIEREEGQGDKNESLEEVEVEEGEEEAEKDNSCENNEEDDSMVVDEPILD